jgi:hypothetical protein
MEKDKDSIEYKGHFINILPYDKEGLKWYYTIRNNKGVCIVDTCWNDDKMWNEESALISAKRTIDNPNDGYIKLFKEYV